MSTGAVASAALRDFRNVLSKPIRRKTLTRALTQALGQPMTSADFPVHSMHLLDKDFASLYPQSILVAEDNMINQKLILNSLKKLGYDAVELAQNGKEAVEKAIKKPYDLIFMDVQMPELDGLEATTCIRGELPENMQPFIISMTASAMPEDQEACRMAGMQDQLSKPFRTQQLKDILEKYGTLVKEGRETQVA
jgi:CheY-like chemotaxis protein